MNFQSDNINEIALALSKAQGEMSSALKDSTNPFFKNKYADLSSVWEACRNPLSKYGLAVLQSLNYQEGKTFLITTLVHQSGQWFKSIAPVIPNKEDIQGLGAAITYMRRYSLCAMIGVTQEDDDGETAMGRTTNSKKNFIGKSQADELINLFDNCSPEYQCKFNEWLYAKKHNSIQEIPENLYSTVKKLLIEKSIEYQNSLSQKTGTEIFND